MVMIGKKRLIILFLIILLSSCAGNSVDNNLKIDYICLSLINEECDSARNVVWQIDNSLEMHYHRGISLPNPGDFCSKISKDEWLSIKERLLELCIVDSIVYFSDDTLSLKDLFELKISIDGTKYSIKGDYFNLTKEVRDFLESIFSDRIISFQQCEYFKFYQSRFFMKHCPSDDTTLIIIPPYWFDNI